MEHAADVFRELEDIALRTSELSFRYFRLNRLLQRVLSEQASLLAADFADTSARLHALCRQAGIRPYPAERFRVHARRVAEGTLVPTPEDFRYDLKAVCLTVSALLGTPLPPPLLRLLPEHWRPSPRIAPPSGLISRIRLTVVRWDERSLYGHDAEHPTEEPFHVIYADERHRTFAPLADQLYEGAQVNLLSVRRDGEVLRPEAVVFEPDFLFDITALCGCIKPYGTTPLAHLLHKFLPAPRSEAICLGNTANQFLDDCVNASAEERNEQEEVRYLHSIRNSFRQAPLAFSTLPGIDADFFAQARRQYGNIRRTVEQKFSAADIDIERSDVQLEPSFLCEALGLQGRMDLLMNDFSKLVELKSGKAEEYPTVHPRREHALQMALYREVLHYNRGVDRRHIQTFLFYARYPRFFNIDVPSGEVLRALALRNALVHQERRLRHADGWDWMLSLRESDFNVSGRDDTFYRTYLQADILAFLRTLHQADALTAAYVRTFLAFLEREQYRAKMGDGNPDSGRGFADTWNGDARTRTANGTLLPRLTLRPVEAPNGAIDRLIVELPTYDEDFLPNFREGDAVMLYERNSDFDNATRQQIFRCTIEKIREHELLLKLTFPQRNARVFHPERHYALEPAYMDSTYTQAYRGLYALLTAPAERRDLILGRRMPRRDTTALPVRRHPDAEIDSIVRQAKQARDYFLLVGPPGTGKTSVALRAMVEELLTDMQPHNILLMAYTNRAVDEICEMLETLAPVPDYVRIGQELSCDVRFRDRLLHHVTADAESRRALRQALTSKHVFVGTIASVTTCPDLFVLKHFDTALVDEASQVLEPQLLPLLCATAPLPDAPDGKPVCAIDRFILIGDHKQLPAVVLQPTELSQVTDEQLHAIGLTDCRNSLFERWHALQARQDTPGIVAMLHRQGRMHPAISAFVNERYYNGRLDCVPLPHQTGAPDFAAYGGEDAWTHFVATTRMGFVASPHTDPEENNKVNRYEARLTARLVATVYHLCRQAGVPFEAARRIGIIVPFRGQIACVRRELDALQVPDRHDITIDTVERYQGSQRDIILFSTTISEPYQLELLSVPSHTDGVSVDRKLNVALTRARKQFFLTGNADLLRRSEAYAALLDAMTPAPC